jgi:hypothetical protein
VKRATDCLLEERKVDEGKILGFKDMLKVEINSKKTFSAVFECKL